MGGMKTTLSILAAVLLPCALFAQVSFSERPLDFQLFPRDVLTNLGVASFKGTTNQSGTVRFEMYRDDVLWTSQSTTVSAGESISAQFGIPAERVNYDFLVTFNGTTVLSVDDVVAGDVFLINGQSNAVAQRWDGTANFNVDTFVRSYGAQFIVDRAEWVQAEGDAHGGTGIQGAVGQWALRLGHLLSIERNLPIALIQNGHNGQEIAYFLRDDANPENPSTNYGRLLKRTRQAGLREGARAMLWFQGESDVVNGVSIATYGARFSNLHAGWMADYPGLEGIYTHQIREGCGNPPDIALREFQRTVPDAYTNVYVASVNGIDGQLSDNCHFAYTNGYKTIGENLSRVLLRDLYGYTYPDVIDPPNPAKISYIDPTHLLIRVRNPAQELTVDPGAYAYFELSGSSAQIIDARVPNTAQDSFSGNHMVLLTLDRAAPEATGLTYHGYTGSGTGPWIKNSLDLGMLAFQDYFIDNSLPVTFATFDADVDGHDVVLSWTTATETNNAGFEVERIRVLPSPNEEWNGRDRSLRWESLGFVNGVGTSSDPQSYVHRVADLAPGSYRFRLKQIDFDGSFEYSPEIEIQLDLPGAFWMSTVYPNPFNTHASVSFSVAQAQALQVTLYDVQGRTIQQLFQGWAEPGEVKALTIPGHTLPAGIYIMHLAGTDVSANRTLTVVR